MPLGICTNCSILHCIMIDINLYRSRIGIFNLTFKSFKTGNGKHEFGNLTGKDIPNFGSAGCSILKFLNLSILYVYLMLMILILAMTVDLKFSSGSKFVVATNQNILPNKITSHLDIRILLNIKFLIILYHLIINKSHVKKFFRHLRKKRLTTFAIMSSIFTV